MFQHKIISLFSIILIIGAIILGYYGCILVMGIICLGFSIWGVFDIRLRYVVPVIYRKKTDIRKIAITLDDGPTDFTPKVLDLLEKYNAKATFFCIGKKIEKYPDICRRIYSEKHQLGNHSYSHSN